MTAQGGLPPWGRGLARPAGLLVTTGILLAMIPLGCGGRTTVASPPPLMPSSATLDAEQATITPAGTPASTDPGGGAVTLIVAGDIGRCDSTADDATGALAASLPGVVATLGDTAYPDGTTQQLEECFGGSWGGVKDRISFAVTGNHDLHTDSGAPLQAYMGSAAARDGHTWFSDDLGAWHVIVLDGNCGLFGWLFGTDCSSDSDQVRWLREDLAASNARCTLALMHQPRFSSGQHGDDRTLGSFWDALYAAGAELVLAGHDHDYERFAPQAPDGTPDDTHGVVQMVVGTGGTDLKGFRAARPNSLVRIDDAHGVLELTLGADSWSFRFLDVDGVTRDAGGGSCH